MIVVVNDNRNGNFNTLSSPIKNKYFHEWLSQPIVSTPQISSCVSIVWIILSAGARRRNTQIRSGSPNKPQWGWLCSGHCAHHNVRTMVRSACKFVHACITIFDLKSDDTNHNVYDAPAPMIDPVIEEILHAPAITINPHIEYHPPATQMPMKTPPMQHLCVLSVWHLHVCSNTSRQHVFACLSSSQTDLRQMCKLSLLFQTLPLLEELVHLSYGWFWSALKQSSHQILQNSALKYHE